MRCTLSALSLYLYAFEIVDRSQTPEDRIVERRCEQLLQKFQSPADTGSKSAENIRDNSANTVRFAYDVTPQNSDRRFSSHIHVDRQEYPVWGLADLKQIDDSHGLWFNLHVPERAAGSGTRIELPIQTLSAFNQDNQLIIESASGNFLGQTLVITVGLTDAQKLQTQQSDRYLHKLSDRCVKALFRDRDVQPSFNRECQLFGSPTFIYSFTRDFTSDFTRDSFGEYHILIWFLPDQQTKQTYHRCQERLFNLFFHQHQILSADRQSKSWHQLIADQDRTIKQAIDLLQLAATHQSSGGSLSAKTLKQFKTQLLELPKLALHYAETLGPLETSRHRISTHLDRYHEQLKQLQYFSAQSPESIACLSQFWEMNAPMLERQEYLIDRQSGATLIQLAIVAIRGLIEIEQVQGDRRLDDRLAASVIAVGTAVIFAATSDYIISPSKPFLIPVINISVHPFLASVTLSIMLGLSTFAIIDKLWHNRVPKK